jgi:tRNA 2-thiouridine synthesizing protein E
MNEPKTDHEGFLVNANDWTLEWAQKCANEKALNWDSIDVEITSALRTFYFAYDLSPAMRPLVKHIKTTVNPDYGTSMWLMHRYGESPARMLALISGLPKPKNCL